MLQERKGQIICVDLLDAALVKLMEYSKEYDNGSGLGIAAKHLWRLGTNKSAGQALGI